MLEKYLSPKERLQMKDMELKALFETIEAINENASEADLYRIYKFTLSSTGNFSKLVIYVKDTDWKCKTHFGTEISYSELPLPTCLLRYTEISDLDPELPLNHFAEFDKIIPVKHKKNILAFVLLGISTQVNAEKLDFNFINALSNIIIVAVENQKFAKKQQQQQEYDRQLDIARNVQHLLFPKKLPKTHQLSLEASYLPHHSVGGDYYDFIQINEHRYLFCIADVSGKGIPAAILMSNFQGALRVLIKKEHQLKHIAEKLNTLIIENSQGENFITAFFLLYDTKSADINYLNAGHNPPFLFQNNQIKRLDEGTTVLGSFPTLPFIETGSETIGKQFLIFAFTDGFTETYNEKGEEFGEDDLKTFLAQNLSLSPKTLHAKLIALLNTFKGKNAYADDITLLSLHVNDPTKKQ